MGSLHVSVSQHLLQQCDEVVTVELAIAEPGGRIGVIVESRFQST